MQQLNPGDLRHSIAIRYKAVTGQDSRGQDVYTWADLVTCHMAVRALNGREVFQFAQTWPNAQAMLEGYFVSGVTTAMRVYDSCCSRTFDIKWTADPDGRRERLHLLGQEIV